LCVWMRGCTPPLDRSTVFDANLHADPRMCPHARVYMLCQSPRVCCMPPACTHTHARTLYCTQGMNFIAALLTLEVGSKEKEGLVLLAWILRQRHLDALYSGTGLAASRVCVCVCVCGSGCASCVGCVGMCVGMCAVCVLCVFGCGCAQVCSGLSCVVVCRGVCVSDIKPVCVVLACVGRLWAGIVLQQV
jgi:hypothetical protein